MKRKPFGMVERTLEVVISNMNLSLDSATSFCSISFLLWAQSPCFKLGFEFHCLWRSKICSTYLRNIKVTEKANCSL